MLHIKFGLIDRVVSEEKMFEYYGDIHVYCPGVGVYEPLGFMFFSSFFFFVFFCLFVFFSESLVFSPAVHFLQDFHFK